MIQLSPRGKAIYQFLSLTVILLFFYAAGFMLSALSLLPASPLAEFTSAEVSRQFAGRMFNLLCLTGCLGAGIMMASESLPDTTLKWWRGLWFATVAIAVALSPFEVGQALNWGISIVLLVLLVSSVGAGASSSYMRVWQFGILLISVGLVATPLLPAAAAEAQKAFQIHVALPLCALSIMFWLMPRYSDLDRQWAEESLKLVAILLCLGGSLISLGRLSPPAVIGLGAAPLIVLSTIILANHSARALRNRNANNSLSPHWIALATLFWLVAAGFLGALSVQGEVSAAMAGTDLTVAQNWLGSWVTVAVILAFVNEAASSLRGDNRRVTGYAPFWLIGFGVGLAFVAQLCRGVAQIYLREVAAVTEVAEAELLLPITALWIICLLAVAVGIVIYALGYFLRLPKIVVVER